MEEKRLQVFADAGEENVAAMLGALKRVEAPGDFDVRVRARIAQGRPSETRSSWMPTLVRIGAPATLLLLVAGYFGYNALYQQAQMDVPVVAVAETAAPQSAMPEPKATEVAASQPTVPVPQPTIAKVEVKTPELASVAVVKKPEKITNSNTDTGGGSVDSALTVIDSLESNAVPPANNGGLPSELSVKDVLGRFGISSVSTGSGWRVESVSGAAARAGVKAGDVVEAINGIPIGVNVMFAKTFVGNSLRVKRDGSVVHISMK
ncbi:MAG: hypothetical protein WBO10_11065 [Pyrinomonadaceae bacterium]